MTDPGIDEFGRAGERAVHIDRIRCAVDRRARLDAINGYYREAWKDVKAVPVHRWAVGIYEVDWPGYMTPIEAAVWGDIREEGAVLYPQHPVGRFFVDFGHPKARVAIECDGAAWHQDRDADRARQAEIESFGWTVFRLTGRQCNEDSTEEYDGTGATILRDGAARTLIREVAMRFGLSAKYVRATA